MGPPEDATARDEPPPPQRSEPGVRTVTDIRHLITASCLVSVTGCLPVAFVTPPIKASVGGGVHLGGDGRAVRNGPGGHIDVRAGVYPLQILEASQGSAFDVGFGYVRQFDLTHNFGQQGAYLEVSLMQPLSPGWRWGLNAGFQALGTGRDAEWIDGSRSVLGLHAEWSEYTEGPFESCDINDPEEDVRSGGFCGGGYAFGTSGIGFYVETGLGRIRGVGVWDINVGLMFRLPASLGAGLLFFGDDDE